MHKKRRNPHHSQAKTHSAYCEERRTAPKHPNNPVPRQNSDIEERTRDTERQPDSMHPTSAHCAYHRTPTKHGHKHVLQGKEKAQKENEQKHTKAETHPTAQPAPDSGRSKRKGGRCPKVLVTQHVIPSLDRDAERPIKVRTSLYPNQ